MVNKYLLSILTGLRGKAVISLVKNALSQKVEKYDNQHITQDDDLWGPFWMFDYDLDGKLSSDELSNIGCVEWSATGRHKFSLKGIELVKDLKSFKIDNFELYNIDGICKLKKIEVLKIVNCGLTYLPDFTKCDSLEDICLDGNKLSLEEISAKLPRKFKGQFLTIARKQNIDSFQHESVPNGVFLNGTLQPDAVFTATQKGNTWDVNISR